MASIKPFLEDILHVNYYIQSRNEIFQKQIIRYYCAARCIQRWVRGHITRCHLKSLHNAATVIQKFWRAMMAKKYYRKLLQVRVNENSLKCYNYKATIIQKTWRGYKVRKWMFNYYQFKDYLRTVNIANEDILSKMNQYHQSVYNAERQEYEEVASKKTQKMLQELHHMLRTTVRPGVFSLSDTSDLSELEKIIASVKLPSTNRVQSQVQKQYVPKIGKLFQGPFLPYEEVMLRKNYIFQPSLQASEPYRTEKQRMEIISLRNCRENSEHFDDWYKDHMQ